MYELCSQQNFEGKKELRLKELKQISTRAEMAEIKSRSLFEDNFAEDVRRSLSLFDIEKEEEEIPEIEESEELPALPDEAYVIFIFNFLFGLNL